MKRSSACFHRSRLFAAAIPILSVVALACALIAADPPGGGKKGGPKGPGGKTKNGGNIVFKVSKPTKEIKEHVLFSHDSHIAKGSACKDCHNGQVFSEEKKIGVNKFTMKDINKGEFCGACHDGTTEAKDGTATFGPTKNCARCHNLKLRP